MQGIVPATLSGLIWGVGDFAGGKASQRANALPVTLLSKLFSLPFLACYLILEYVPIQLTPVLWGALAGTSGMLGMIVFYRALSFGSMSIVAPITAVTSAALPVVFGLLRGEQPSAVRMTGVICALTAIVLVSLVPSNGRREPISRQLLLSAVLAGALFALFFILLDLATEHATTDPGLWPIAGSQFGAILLGATLVAVRRPKPWPRGRALGWTGVAGPLDMTANALFLIAVGQGPITVIALAALYPVTTVILALVIDRERLRGVQVLGIVLAILALILVNQ